jgi:hypothetical protein
MFREGSIKAGKSSFFLIFGKIQAKMNAIKTFARTMIGSLLLLVTFCPSGFSQITVTIGNGTNGCPYPYSTFWGCGRTQMLYTKAEIASAGGVTGTISSIGLEIGSFDPILMENFNIKLRNTDDNILLAWVMDSMTTCYSASYKLLGTGWQMITLQAPFTYDGRNLIVEICYTNTTSSNNSYVNGSVLPQQILTFFMDNGTGCDLEAIDNVINRPNLQFIEQSSLGISTVPVSHQLNIYPNPVDKTLYVSCEDHMISAELSDLSGKVICKGIMTNAKLITFAAGQLQDGLYLVNVFSENGLSTEKVVVRH